MKSELDLRLEIDDRHRRYWKDRMARQPRKQRKPIKSSIDLGLEISRMSMQPGERRTVREIAYFCDCSPSAIWLIESSAIHKLKRRLFLQNDPVLKELLEDF